jgi:hypothetical protein
VVPASARGAGDARRVACVTAGLVDVAVGRVLERVLVIFAKLEGAHDLGVDGVGREVEGWG